MLKSLFAALLAVSASGAFAATYHIDPSHTYPSFEADHMGISVWRGKFTKSSGTVEFDPATKSGAVDISIDAASLDFGHERMNKHAKGADMFDVEKFPTARYQGKLAKFNEIGPSEVQGELTLKGVTKPVTLTIHKFKCIMHPMLKREVCGADASAAFSRSDFGLDYGLPRFSPEVKLSIQVEAIKAE